MNKKITRFALGAKWQPVGISDGAPDAALGAAALASFGPKTNDASAVVPSPMPALAKNRRRFTLVELM
tara:strand:- start:7426 stop:7629 length:204 start_codon:yes stop_codon:yes gene_type:complete